MIVWGGYDRAEVNTGGIYDPATDTWTPTSTVGAPSARREHTAVWTGSKMVVWGGWDTSRTNTGGAYDPATDTWTPTSTVGAAAPCLDHTAVWTGSKMIVWGGWDAVPWEQTGGVYDPATDSWPTLLVTGADWQDSTAVWAGARMIVWGGQYFSERTNWGSAYDAATNTWRATSTFEAPSPRLGHSAVAMGSKMIIWGGVAIGEWTSTGGIYDLVTDTWTATSTIGAPSGRDDHTAVWTGSKMIVWGGYMGGTVLNTGGIYVPAGPQGPLLAGTERVFPLVPLCGIPDGAQGLSVNMTVTEATTQGNVRLYPAGGTPLPNVSSINYVPGLTRANNAVVKPNASGEVAVWCSQASGTAHFILDVSGYFDSSGSFFTLTPCRLVDTRNP